MATSLDDLFRQQQQQQLSGAGNEQSIPLFAGLTGAKDVKKGVLELLSANGGLTAAQVDTMGLFRETFLTKIIKGGFDSVKASGSGGDSPSYVARVSGSGGGGSDGPSLG